MSSRRSVISRAVSASLLAIALVTTTAAGAARAGDAEEKSAEWPDATYDAVVLRPLQTVAVVFGAALFVPAAIVSSPGGRPAVYDAWDIFVAEPADTAFKRPLGSF